MKRKMLALLAATSVATGIPAVASAQYYGDRDYNPNYNRNWDGNVWSWQGMNINQYQARLDQRIDVGIRNGMLTRAEATNLRNEFRAIANLEMQYRRNGLTAGERAELDRRLDNLDRRVTLAVRDDDQRWANLNQRQAMFNDRLARAINDRRISQRQADYLRQEFRSIAQLERQYRRNGLTYQERADLDRRFDRLETNFRAQVNTSQYGYGYGYNNLFDFLFNIR